jgi:hypothetical protein
MGLYRTYLPAKTVETVLETRLQETETEVYSAPYWNMREKGFSFYRAGYEPFPTYVYVCEGRSTDQIMVTVSANMGWDRVTEDEYLSAQYFAPTAYEEVAEYILRELRVLDPVTGSL